MFTGLIEEIGVIKNVQASGSGKILTIQSSTVITDSRIGDSIAVDGACQTITATGSGYFSVLASSITCSLTTLGSLATGDRVNLERATTLNKRLGGHLVQGHVDGQGTIERIIKDDTGLKIDIAIPADLERYLIVRGSVAIDGISLTIVSLRDGGFSLYLIPETIRHTTLNNKKTGDRVNIETDLIAKYIERLLAVRDHREHDDGRLMDTLRDNGFV